jgi:redox-sensitive bicupin YhaK (pirin superfamily)
MKKHYHRRRFLEKITLGLSSVFALPLLGRSATEKKGNMMEKTAKIMRIKPLGFQWETADPFLFCVHHEDKYPKGNEKMGPVGSLEGRYLGQDFIVKDGYRMYHGMEVPGFPGHPHRGFETITVVREGFVDHADSMGSAGRYGNGDVQWMTAGKGVQHSEMFPLIHTDKENPLELFQIWLNLPRKSKMVNPHFKMIWNDAVPRITELDLHGKKAEIEVLVGKLKQYQAPSSPPDSWAAHPTNEVGVFNIQLEPNATWEIPVASMGINRTIYYYEGEGLSIENTVIPSYHAVEVDATQTLTFTNGNITSKILVLQGRPINEPVVQHGPFVMNTKEEIYQAFEDYQRTQFGGWPWPKNDQVHDRSSSRFARHADGTLEQKS